LARIVAEISRHCQRDGVIEGGDGCEMDRMDEAAAKHPDQRPNRQNDRSDYK